MGKAMKEKYKIKKKERFVLNDSKKVRGVRYVILFHEFYVAQ